MRDQAGKVGKSDCSGRVKALGECIDDVGVYRFYSCS